MGLQIRLFGPFEVIDQDSGEVLDWPRKQTQTLLKIFLTAPGVIFSQDQLVDALTPDQEYDKAIKNLQKRISELRKSLEPDRPKGQKSSYIESPSQGNYRFEPESDCEIDTELFKAHIEAAYAFMQSEQPSNALMEFDKALELRRGELLNEDLYEDWAMEPRASFEELYRVALESMAECHSQLHQYRRALEHCEQALQLDPLKESLYQSKMRYHYYAGEPHQALQTYQQCSEILDRELGLKPSEETLELYESLKNHSVTLPPKNIPNNLPFQLTSFIGRKDVITELSEQLTQARLITLTGVGGTGKTRLAIQIGSDLIQSFEDGVWFVGLGDIDTAGYVEKHVASTLGLQEAPGQPLIESLKNYLQNKQLLLILDNCEHLIDASAKLIETLLVVSTDLKVIATSREVLGVAGELVRVLQPLSMPDINIAANSRELREYEAVSLFIERLLPQQPEFILNDENAPIIAEICQRLDGIPLAIELAAAQANLLSPKEILTRLSDRFQLLTKGSRTALPHHQTLQAAVDWSYDLINEREKMLLHRVSIFGSSFSLEAAESICAGEGLEQADVYTLMRDLIDKSLVYVDRQTDEIRYRLLETIREYALKRLAESGDEDRLRSAHRSFYLGLAEEAEPHLKRADQVIWFERLELEAEHIRAALGYSLQENQIDELIRIAVALQWFWFARGHQREGRDWYERAIEASENAADDLKAKLYYNASALTWNMGEYEETERLAHEALKLCTTTGDKWGEAYSHSRLAIVAEFQGNYEQSEASYNRSLEIAREIDDSWLISVLVNNLAEIERRKGEFDSAEALVREGLDLSNQRGDTWCSSQLSFSLGVVKYEQEAMSDAAQLFEEALEHKRELNDNWGVANLLYSLGRVKTKLGDLPAAIDLYSQSRSLYDELGERRGYAFGSHWLGVALTKYEQYQTSMEILKEALEIRHGLEDSRGIAESLEGLAALLLAIENYEQSARLLGAAVALRDEVGVPLSPADQADIDEIDNELKRQLKSSQAQKLMSEGAVLSTDDICKEALAITL